jgi:hypothetical protein
MFRKLCLLITPIECNPSQIAMDVSINSPLKYYAANETANERRANKKPISKAVLHSCPRLRFNTLRVYAAKPQWQRRIHTHTRIIHTHVQTCTRTNKHIQHATCIRHACRWRTRGGLERSRLSRVSQPQQTDKRQGGEMVYCRNWKTVQNHSC